LTPFFDMRPNHRFPSVLPGSKTAPAGPSPRPVEAGGNPGGTESVNLVEAGCFFFQGAPNVFAHSIKHEELNAKPSDVKGAC
jgi:hypothetical protein